MKTLDRIQHWFEERNLPCPYIPTELQESLVEISEAVYGTRPEAPDLYNLAYFSQEVMTQPMPDYLLLGYSGYGMNSSAIHYYLVRGPLALFVQHGWGGVYEDKDLERESIIHTFQTIKRLIQKMEAEPPQRFQPGTKLVIEDSSFYGSRWVLLDSLLTPDSSFDLNSSWHKSFDALSDVLTTVFGEQ